VHAPVERVLARDGAGAYGTIVVDPPRTGLGAAVAGPIASARVPTVVYVSCDPVTLARDVRTFVEAGYEPADVRAFDLFPRTAHVETVVTLTARRQGA
jgi:tRNA/tmRNA/rRNA uracil-C5-methylase (TrmA/RlmC/RlmD family)